MIDISLHSVGKYFGDVQILKDITFDVQEGEKVALIGKNGCGKTTLFRVISGEERFEEGDLAIHRTKRLAVLDQLPVYPDGMTVRDVMETAFIPLRELQREMHELELLMGRGINDTATLAKYGELQVRFEVFGGYDTETELFRTALGLGVPKEMWDRPYAMLSGGEKTRVNLVRMLLEKTDIMLLDEPTNHLDMQAVEWLENYLQTFRGTVLVISHDRYFLDRVTQKTIELENLTATVYDGSYSFYVQQKAEREEEVRRRHEKLQKEIDRLSFTSDRMHGWGLGDKKMMRRAFALDKRIERIKANQPQLQKKEKQMTGKLHSADRSGYDVLFVDRLSKYFGERCILNKVDLEVKKDESIALLGENGCGKTTFLKLLLGESIPDSGHIKWGANIKFAYLPQQVEFADPYATVLDTVMTELGLTDGSARNRLGSFHFRGDDVFKTVSVLSGGEKSRLKLCILLYKEINVLILDEPTNHLDIASREWMEGLLEEYEGTMLFVSHDRYFIDRFATGIWNMADGAVTPFKGTYAQYRRSLELQTQTPAEKAEPTATKAKREYAERGESLSRRIRRAEKAVAVTEREIAAAESELEALQAKIEEVATDPDALMALYAEQEPLDAKIAELYARWETETEALAFLNEENEV
ncbi:MAG: ABC-F family ATP-binding cassette domain-containing protein [Clostridia bacterium]|nr:ABC-F family ATP-binding cassette domain-containing protein [Clostridia bacterium]